MPHYSTGSVGLCFYCYLLRLCFSDIFRYLIDFSSSNVAHLTSLFTLFLSSFFKYLFWVGRVECLLSIKINQNSVTLASCSIYTCSTFLCLSPSGLARVFVTNSRVSLPAHFTSRVISSLALTLFCLRFVTFLTHCALGYFALLHLKLHRLRRLRLQCTTRVQLPVSVSVYGNRGPLCLSLTAFALRLLGRNAPTTFSRRSHRVPARPASSSTSASSSLLSSYRLVSRLLYCYTVCSAHTLNVLSKRERAYCRWHRKRARESATSCSPALSARSASADASASASADATSSAFALPLLVCFRFR